MKLYRVHQKLLSNPLADIPGEVWRQLDGLALSVPKGDIAITAGSRGIANIDKITRAVGDWLKARGARPFIVPCMGSHNGATAEGQRSMVASLGITETAMDMEIRASMDVVKIGDVETGPVYMDRHCHESAGVVVLNRIKLHTSFSGPAQSGIVKMMVVGMGKIESAKTFHLAPTPRMKDMLFDMGRFIIKTGKILAGVAILEDGYDQTMEIHAISSQDIFEVEPRLLERHRTYFPHLPVDELNVLVIDEIGKLYSGTGMDTNVVGYRCVKSDEDKPTPSIRIIAALRLHPKSQGNAVGVGLADFITQQLRDAIDERKTLTNVMTTGSMNYIKIPATLPSEEKLVQSVRGRFGDTRWMFIPNTLHLGTLYVTEDLKEELLQNPRCDVNPIPVELTFRDGRHELRF